MIAAVPIAARARGRRRGALAAACMIEVGVGVEVGVWVEAGAGVFVLLCELWERGNQVGREGAGEAYVPQLGGFGSGLGFG